MSTATILGAGVMGTATSWPLSDNGHEIRLVGTHLDRHIIQSCKEENIHPRLNRKLPKNVTPYYLEELETALDGADFILSGVNSMGVHWIGQRLAPFVKAGTKIIAITKGLEASDNGDLLILPEVMRSELPEEVRGQVSLAAIGGPCIAGELAGRRQTCVYFGSRDMETAQYLTEIFRTSYYHVTPTNDIVALELAVALKNAYALGVGLASGLLNKFGGVDEGGAHMHNTAAALFARGAAEIHLVLETMGANADFAYGLPGIGDMYVTSTGGRSVTVGRLLGEGKTFKEVREIMKGETLEAVMIIEQMAKALPKLEARGLITSDQLPLMQTLVDTVVKGKSLQLDFDHFF